MFLLIFEFVFVLQCGNLDIFLYAYSISQVGLIVPFLRWPKWFLCQMACDVSI